MMMYQRVCARFHALGRGDVLAVKANRRAGKTRMVCLLAAQLALDSCHVCIVAGCRRKARLCLQQVAHLLPGSEILEDDKKVLSDNKNGWVHCGTKPIADADIILVDDAPYMCPTVYEEILLAAEGAKTLLIGTPTGHPNNVFARMCRLKDVCHIIDARHRAPAL